MMSLSDRVALGGLSLATKFFGAKHFAEPGSGNPLADSRLTELFGPTVFEGIRNRTVLDMGCGHGNEAVRFALEGAHRVVAVDINAGFIDGARRLAERFGVLEKIVFINADENPQALDAFAGAIDIAFSIDAFEHYRDPAAMLQRFYEALRPGGALVVAFGPPWYHPFGAHMDHFCRMPWIHFVFAERVVLKARARVRDDGATCYEETESGPNRMTVARFEALVERSEFSRTSFELVPIRGLHPLVRNRVTREYFTSIVRAELAKPANAPIPAFAKLEATA